MCGIAGVLGRRGVEPLVAAKAMCDAIVHRGPDNAGFWCDESHDLAFGHRRLSIIDLSAAGHQPMLSASDRYAITFNGEIYNFPQLKRELELTNRAAEWRGQSDTEVLLAAIDIWGLETTLPKLNGMFVFALWDRQGEVLHLVRDRAGQKPLYYGNLGGTFAFGSEMAAIRAHPGFRAPIDKDALSLFLRHNYIPHPHTIFAGIYQLPPACRIEVRDGRAGQPIRWWLPQPQRTPADPRAAVDALDRLLRGAVKRRMISDVPLGALLSGGIDSSVVVAMMQDQSSKPVRTFTIGFGDERLNEANHAKAVAKHLGTDHTELYVSAQDARDIIPRLAGMHSEPFGDSSQIPTWFVCELARRQVTVAISGDGGDEILGGYTRYPRTMRKWNWLRRAPSGVRRAAAFSLSRFPHRSARGQRLPHVLRAKSPDDLYRMSVSHSLDPSSYVPGSSEPKSWFSTPHPLVAGDFAERMMRQDFVTYLPDDILTKVDRASMSVSLELRAPLLDVEVVEFAMALPLALKMRNGVGKWPLRELLYRYVPKTLVDRPKAGFAIPLANWLRGPLQEWSEDLLSSSRLHNDGFLSPQRVQTCWERFQRGDNGYQGLVWNLLMFQAWLTEHDAA